jgi:hypothetical protein
MRSQTRTALFATKRPVIVPLVRRIGWQPRGRLTRERPTTACSGRRYAPPLMLSVELNRCAVVARGRGLADLRGAVLEWAALSLGGQLGVRDASGQCVPFGPRLDSVPAASV